MSVPIRNLLYLFLYAWARFSGGGVLREAGIDESPDLPNLFARLLLAGNAQDSLNAVSTAGIKPLLMN